MPTPIAQLLSRTVYAGDGVTTSWDFSFSGGYLDRDHVKAYTETATGARTALTLAPGDFTGDYQVTVTPAVPFGTRLTIYRDTPKDLPLADFTDGSRFTEVSLDVMAKQAVFIAAETTDVVNTSDAVAAGLAAAAAAVSAEEAQEAASLALAASSNFPDQVANAEAAAVTAANAALSANAGVSAATDASSAAVSAAAAAQATATAAASAATAAQNYTPSGTGGVSTSVAGTLRLLRLASTYGATGSGSDETAKVQLAINAVPSTGGSVWVNDGVKFNLRSLTFPTRVNLSYRLDDDLSSPAPGGDAGSGERVYFSANSSYPLDPSGGTVNEWRYTAPYHPGVIVDVRQDVTGHDGNLAPGQSRTNPARASYSIHSSQTDAWRTVYEHYDTYSQFSMVSMHGWRRTYVLNGIGTAQWGTVPAVNTLITGTTSGAKGFVLSVSAGATTVLWFSGKFQVGETVSDDDETTTAIISTAVFTLAQFSPLAQGLTRGNWAIGLPADSVTDMFAVGGRITSAKTRGGPFYTDTSVLHPGFNWVDTYEGISSGLSVIYDTTPAAASRRLTLRTHNGSADRGLVGGLTALTEFNNGAFKSVSSFNVASVVRTGTGLYTINFDTPFVRADYAVAFGPQDPTDFATWFVKGTSSLTIRVYNPATATLKDLTGYLNVTISGGDI